MIKTLQKSNNDLLESFNYINHLFAGFRGILEFYRFLESFQHRAADPNSIAQTEKILNKIDRWVLNHVAGEALISSRWQAPETFEAHEALSAMKTLLQYLEQHASSIETILSMDTELITLEDLKYLAAGAAQIAFSRQYFLLGLNELGVFSGNPEGASQAAEGLVESESEVELAIGIFGTLKEATSLDQQFVQNFIEYVANLPSILRTQIHESFILWRYFEPEAITFDAIGVSRMEQERWETGGINAFEAGYWIARSISPEEAIGWKLGGILTPESARAWKTAKFTPSSATPWVEVGIDPAIAAEWSQEGYKPDIAAAYLKKNIPVPSAIPGRR